MKLPNWLFLKYVLGIKYSKKNWLCKLGLHDFKTVTERSGYIDCGEKIVCLEQTYDKCTRNSCSISRGRKNGRWIEFVKQQSEQIEQPNQEIQGYLEQEIKPKQLEREQ